MKIVVTEEHIEQGQPLDATQCPIALALKPHFPSYTVFAGTSFLEFSIGGSTIHFYVTPPAASAFIRDFDDGAPVQPFEFEIQVFWHDNFSN